MSLATELNHTTTSGGLTIRHQLTPLTGLSFAVTRDQDRFESSSTALRDSNSTAFTGTLTFDPAALLRGSATVGYRDFQPLSPDLPGYAGATAAVDLSYAIFGTTKFSVTATRDVQYSYDVTQPYYLLTGFTGSVAQEIFGPLDIVGRIGIQSLAYRDATTGCSCSRTRPTTCTRTAAAWGTTSAGTPGSDSTSIRWRGHPRSLFASTAA